MSAIPQHQTGGTRDPWAPPPIMEGLPLHNPPSPHEAAHDAAQARRSQVLDRIALQVLQGQESHRHREAQRQAEAEACRARLERLENRLSAERPLLRDGAIGFAGTMAPLSMLLSGSKLSGPKRHAALIGVALAALLAGHQWMEARSESRTARLEDEIDRQRLTLARRSIPSPTDHEDLRWHALLHAL